MTEFKNKIIRFMQDESGPTAVEYAVMMALIIATAIASISLFGNTTQAVWGSNTGSITNAIN